MGHSLPTAPPPTEILHQSHTLAVKGCLLKATCPHPTGLPPQSTACFPEVVSDLLSGKPQARAKLTTNMIVKHVLLIGPTVLEFC